MRYFVVSLCLIIVPLIATAKQLNTKTVASRIDSVTVFLNGAEVNRKASIDLPAGRTELLFNNLSHKMNNNSVKINTSRGLTILAVVCKNTDRTTVLSENLQAKQDSLNNYANQMVAFNSERDALKMEQEVLKLNKTIGGQQNGVNVNDLKMAASFYRERTEAILNQLASIEQETKVLQQNINTLKKRFNEVQAIEKAPKKEIIVTVQASEPIKATINVRYLLSHAQWQPYYNIRAVDVNKPVSLEYKAKVYNNTGSDWNEVQLKLSTADPTQDASKPALKQAWTLRFDSQSLQGEGRLNNYYNSNDGNTEGDSNFTEIEVASLSAAFDIKERYTLVSSNIPAMIDVTTYVMNEVTYTHFCIPKIKKEVFLLAKITGWEDLDLIASDAGVYYGNTYIGQSYLNTHSMKDTLDISLGPDAKVIAHKAKLKDNNSKKWHNLFVKEAFAYEIAIKNNRNIPVTVEVWDQVPVSQDKDITVNLTELSKANIAPENGKLDWILTLNPKENKKLLVAFDVKYPRFKQLIIQDSKQIKTPRYF